MMRDTQAQSVPTGALSSGSGAFHIHLAVDQGIPASGQLTEAILAAQPLRRDGTGDGSRQPCSQAPPVIELVDLDKDEERERIVQRLFADANTRLVVVYPNPIVTVAAELERGEGNTDVVGAWKDASEALLQLFRGHRRQVVLVDGLVAAGGADRLAEELKSRLAIELDPSKLPSFQDDWLGRPIARLIAAHGIAASEEAKQVFDELEASSLPLDIAVQAGVGELLADWRQVDAAEHELLALQLRQAQEELEACYLDKRELQNRTQELDRNVRTLGETVDDLNQVRKDLVAARHELDLTRTAVDDLQSSLSWRLTAPLRRILGSFRGGSGD